jgi:cytochrome c-type biogenesis protein
MDAAPAFGPLMLAAALGAGVLSFVSPCVLPLVPAYLSFITGLSAEEVRQARGGGRLGILGHGAAFVAGLAVIFALLGASATLLGRLLLANQVLLTQASGVVVVLFGLHLLGVLRIPLLYRTARVADVGRHATGSYLGAFLMGLAFGAGWTPCIGPFLATLLALAAAESTVAQGTLLLVVYALGLGLPFLLAGVAVDRSMSLMGAIRPHLGLVEKASGVLLVGMGVLLFTQRFTLITIWLTAVLGNGLAL